jgi:hypothetical protein
MKNSRSLVKKSALSLAILSIIITALGCGPGHPTPPPLPFKFDIDLPTGTNTALELNLQPGTSTTLPVILRSTKNKVIEVKVLVDLVESAPEGIAIDFPEDYITLPAGENITFNIVYNIGKNVLPGRYHTMLTGTTKEPIEGLGQAIDIIITEKP